MKYLLLIILLINLNYCFIIDNNNRGQYKISEKLINKINDNSNNLKIWIEFTVKDISHHNDNSFVDNSSGDNLTKKQIIDLIGIHNDSIERRSKRIASTIDIDNHDLPISDYFIKEVLNCNNNIILNYKSNWLNSISISIKNKNKKQLKDIVNCIQKKSFVKNLDLVLKYKNNLNRKNNSNDNDNNNNNNNLKFQNKLLELNIKNNYSNKTINEIFNNTNKVKLDEKFYGLSYKGLKQANIDKLHQEGYYGTNIKILIIDSGFYKDHESLKHINYIGEYNYVDKKNDTQDEFDPNLTDPTMSQNAHGTATLSVIGGFAPGKLIGSAFNASYFLAKTEIIFEENLVEEDYWIAALEMGERMGIDLVTSSLGYKEWYRFSDLNGKTTRISKAANLAIKKGLVIVISTGNDDKKGIDSPTDSEYVIAVGGVTPSGHEKSFISSMGPSSDGRIKPDIMALGEQVQIAYFTGKDHYRLEIGTSFSSQIVAGGIALIMEKNKDWNAYQIYEAITKTASKANNPDINMGYGIFNAYAASQYNPSKHSCIEVGCLNNGVCKSKNDYPYDGHSFEDVVIGHCKCPPAYYGIQCQYKREICNQELCNYRYGVCQINEFLKENNSLSYNCISPNNIKKLKVNFDPNILILKTNNSTNNSNNSSSSSNNSSDNTNNNSLNKNNNNNNNNSISNEKFILIICIIVGFSVLIITILLILSIKLFLNIKLNIKNNSMI
ncbi:hypothetical protein DICPUDRAFT_47162 [Dictyostelium purpureum]|uniref:EGF-like domain-containing protein n=1 Tax=Dictyostelium purpureum TaxID=5786 RepID=F0ZI18_DICPU|nr:uncharacterized protein DICPUDRAFT_47162 [Dictyostelium purpureum]EGC36416.1 hypothetical protein DICPUDRAFT_47162 [Dictyostelium purpureum]|eukprot:XP_003287049.1 hypothetical protein DICPUDRAFT_47162 [Dictyostelium purpureum]